jgi:hypothetical protein
MSKAMLRCEHTGLALGDAALVKKLESLLGRVLTRRKPGPKENKTAKRTAGKGRR